MTKTQIKYEIKRKESAISALERSLVDLQSVPQLDYDNTVAIMRIKPMLEGIVDLIHSLEDDIQELAIELEDEEERLSA